MGSIHRRPAATTSINLGGHPQLVALCQRGSRGDLAVPKVTQFLFQANVDKATAACNSIAQGVSFYMTRNRGILPDDFNLDMLLEGDNAYLGNANDLIDPWGHPYEIDIPGDINGDFDVISLGPDGQRSEDDIVNGSTG